MNKKDFVAGFENKVEDCGQTSQGRERGPMDPNMLDVALFGPALVEDWHPTARSHSGDTYRTVIECQARLNVLAAETKSCLSARKVVCSLGGNVQSL